MRSERVKYYLEKKGVNAKTLTDANLKKLSLEDQMILSLITGVIEHGNHSAFKVLMDAAYGVMKPGEGADRIEEEGVAYQANFQNIESKPKINKDDKSDSL